MAEAPTVPDQPLLPRLQGPEASHLPSTSTRGIGRPPVSGAVCLGAQEPPGPDYRSRRSSPPPGISGSGQASPGRSLTQDGVPLGAGQREGSLTIGVHFQDRFLGLERRSPPGYV